MFALLFWKTPRKFVNFCEMANISIKTRGKVQFSIAFSTWTLGKLRQRNSKFLPYLSRKIRDNSNDFYKLAKFPLKSQKLQIFIEFYSTILIISWRRRIHMSSLQMKLSKSFGIFAQICVKNTIKFEKPFNVSYSLSKCWIVHYFLNKIWNHLVFIF